MSLTDMRRKNAERRMEANRTADPLPNDLWRVEIAPSELSDAFIFCGDDLVAVAHAPLAGPLRAGDRAPMHRAYAARIVECMNAARATPPSSPPLPLVGLTQERAQELSGLVAAIEAAGYRRGLERRAPSDHEPEITALVKFVCRLQEEGAVQPTACRVDWLGMALELESQSKRVESQTVERAMLAAAHGLRLMGTAAPQPVPASPVAQPSDNEIDGPRRDDRWADGSQKPNDAAAIPCVKAGSNSGASDAVEASPAPAGRVPLTQPQVQALHRAEYGTDARADAFRFARAIEAAHGIAIQADGGTKL